MRKRCFFFIGSAMLLGYFAGEIHCHKVIGFEYKIVRNFFTETKIFAEVVYFIMASLLIPIAYRTYRDEKKKEKKGAVEYSHRLFQYYTEQILILDRKYDKDFRDGLSRNGNAEKNKEFNDFLNKIDTFAAAFMHGIADPESGKLMMGNAYCEQIQRYLPAIKRISIRDYREGYENLFGLWDKWKSKDG